MTNIINVPDTGCPPVGLPGLVNDTGRLPVGLSGLVNLTISCILIAISLN